LKALVYDKPESFAVREVPDPVCGENDVIIRVAVCGICKTDVHIHHGRFISQFPLIPGHEFAGTVAKVGSAVTDFKIGDRVTGDNTVLCGSCYYCRRDQPLYCERFFSRGVTAPGGLAQYVVVGQDKAFHVPENLSFEEAAMTEPTACVVHGMDVMDVQPGDDVLLFGCGPTGIILAQMIKHCGAARLVAADPGQFKLDLVSRLGADNVVCVDRQDSSVHRKKIKNLQPRGFDIIVDATGNPQVVQECFDYAKKGSKILIYGVCPEDARITISPYEIFQNEYKILGSFAQTHCFDRAIEALGKGIVKVKELITHRFLLEEYGQALDTVSKPGKKHKVVITPNAKEP
jgi:D-arabinitol dehydrogenase (NADP+)